MFGKNTVSWAVDYKAAISFCCIVNAGPKNGLSPVSVSCKPVALHQDTAWSLFTQRDFKPYLKCSEGHLGGFIGSVSNCWSQLRSGSQGREFKPHIGLYSGCRTKSVNEWMNECSEKELDLVCFTVAFDLVRQGAATALAVYRKTRWEKAMGVPGWTLVFKL